MTGKVAEKKSRRKESQIHLSRKSTMQSLKSSRLERNEIEDWYAIEPVQLPQFISILCQYIMIYETLICMLLCLNMILFPYECFFNVYDAKVANFVFTLDTLYGIDVVLRLLVEEWRYRTQTRCKVFMFPYSLGYCMMDIISLSPGDRILILLNNSAEIKFSDLDGIEFFQTFTLFRIYRVFIYFRELEVNGLLYETIIFVAKFSFIYLTFIVFVSVGYFWFIDVSEIDFFLLTRDREKLFGTWANRFYNNELIDTPIGFFILAINFATVVATTVGYGDVTPKTEGEMLGSIVVMLIGAIFLSGWFQSQITSFCLQLDGARLDLFHRLDGIKITLREANMGEFFIAKVEVYYKCLWTYREGVDRVMFLQHLPVSFQEDIFYDICLEMFYKSHLFRGLDEAFLRAVSKVVTIALYNPGMIVCRYGGYANKMYYIIQGECQAMSKHDPTKRAAILRAGSIIGETNLFFSCPYTISVETKTCCQIMCLDKEELMRIFSKFTTELSILRSRCQNKIDNMYFYYEKKGEDPICWVEMKLEAFAQTKMHKSSIDILTDPKWPYCTMRWGYGFNDVVTDDVILDAEEYVIFDFICEDANARKNHVAPYINCVVPEIFGSDMQFVRKWNLFILLVASITAFNGPYCLAFSRLSRTNTYTCGNEGFGYITDLIYIVDVFVEIMGAVPVDGIYYKFKDGLVCKKNDGFFLLDVIAATPLSFFETLGTEFTLTNVIFKSTKIWKVFRYLNYMDNIHPKHVFWFRLMQTCLVLIYGIHFIACTVFFQACPHIREGKEFIQDCSSQTSWLDSYMLRQNVHGATVINDDITVKSLSTKSPYLISFFYGSATLTSAGFGDFSPQNKEEMCWGVVFTLIGFFLICYYTSVLTSALSCIVKPRLEFQQKLVAVRRFLNYYKLPDTLQRRIEQYYELQHQVRHGINIPHGIEHFLWDAPDYLKNDYLYTATVLLLDGVPLFSKVDSKYIIKMADLMRRFLIPPNVTFLYMGEVRRAMYILQAGSVGVYEENAERPKRILEASSHFGIRDLLFGEPSHYTIRTLSYCYIYEITNDEVLEVFEEDTELLDLIDDEREARHEEIEAMYNQYSALEREQQLDRYVETPSWIYFRPSKCMGGRRSHQYFEYIEEFKLFKTYGMFFRYVLLNGTIHPAGAFARFWTCWMSLVSCAVITKLFLETFMHIRTPHDRITYVIIDVLLYMDIYVKMHWGYYHPKTGLLISHPLKTASNYVYNGSFFMDCVSCSPLHLLMWAYGKTDFLGYGSGATWVVKLRWIMFLNIRRVPALFSIAHGIFVNRTLVLMLLFISLTMVVCTTVGAVAIFIACPWSANDWLEGDEYRLPACTSDNWANTKFGGNHSETQRVLSDVTNRWLFGLYYVSQTLLVIGFGDMITLKSSEIFMLIMMSVFGFVFMRCILADITAAEVDTDEIRARFTDGMKTLHLVLTRENINKKLIVGVNDHLNNVWKRSKGLQPGQLFHDLYTSLESDVFRSFVGDTLRKVAVFKDFTPNVLRSLCLYLRKLHFLKGERLMQCGNLEYEMYIIITGKVWITDKKLSYGCTLGRYETFGESSMLSYSARRYTAVAATNVEVFVISKRDFDNLIERYPKVKGILTSLLHNGDYDYFEYKIYEMIDRLKELAGDARDRQIDILHARTNEIKSVISGKGTISKEEAGDMWIKKSKRSWLTRFIDCGTDDDVLPFIYFVARRNTKTGKYSTWPPLLHPNCTFSKAYFTFIYLCCFVSPAMAVYEFSFCQSYLRKLKIEGYKPVTTDEKIQAYIHTVGNDFELFLLTYIVMNLITPFQNEYGQYIKEFVPISMSYVFSIDGIWLDLVASVPGIIWTANRYVIFYTRFVRIYRYYSHYQKKSEDLSVSPFRLKIQLSVSTFILLAHFTACMFYIISDCEDAASDIPCLNTKAVEHSQNITYTWTYAFATDREIESNLDPGMDRWRWWLRSLYWVVTVVSTTGFGDIVPQNSTEMIMGIVCFFIGAFILSIILSSFTAGMTSVTKAHREYLYQVKLLLKYLNNVGLSEIRQGQANAYFDLLWDRCRGKMYHEVIAILPTTMRIEVSNALFQNVLNKVFLFNLNDPTFIRQVAACVKHSIYLPGVCIVKEGDLGSSMFIVMKGYVSGIVSNDDDSGARELKKVYLIGDVFGKLPCLFHNEWYRKSYRAEGYTEVLELVSRDVIHLAAVYPEFWKLLKAYVEITYDHAGVSDCIFSPQKAKQKNIFDLGEDYQVTTQTQQKKKAQKMSVSYSQQPTKGQSDHHDNVKQTHSARHSVTHVKTQSKEKKAKAQNALNVKEPIKFLYDTEHLKTLREKHSKYKKHGHGQHGHGGNVKNVKEMSKNAKGSGKVAMANTISKLRVTKVANKSPSPSPAKK